MPLCGTTWDAPIRPSFLRKRNDGRKQVNQTFPNAGGSLRFRRSMPTAARRWSPQASERKLAPVVVMA